MTENKKATIKSVAKLAGVSTTTVSRVLNESERVKPVTRAKVLEVMASMNYRPDPAAKALGGSKSHFIAMIVPNIINSSIIRIIQGVMEEIHSKEYELLLYDFNADARMEKQIFNELSEKIIDGIIMFTSLVSDSDIVKLSSNVPTVILEREVNGLNVDCLLADELVGMRILVNHLMSNGHRKVGLINGKRGTSTAKRRGEYFKAVMKENGLEITEKDIVDATWHYNSASDALRELLVKDNALTAIVCANDQIALGVLGVAYQLGIRVPEELSVVGFDNAEFGQYSVPPLTTLSHPAHQMGTLAASYLLDRIEDPSSTTVHRTLPLSLVERQSVAKPRNKSVKLNVE